jgi:hypothetical protein
MDDAGERNLGVEEVGEAEGNLVEVAAKDLAGNWEVEERYQMGTQEGAGECFRVGIQAEAEEHFLKGIRAVGAGSWPVENLEAEDSFQGSRMKGGIYYSAGDQVVLVA